MTGPSPRPGPVQISVFHNFTLASLVPGLPRLGVAGKTRANDPVSASTFLLTSHLLVIVLTVEREEGQRMLIPLAHPHGTVSSTQTEETSADFA